MFNLHQLNLLKLSMNLNCFLRDKILAYAECRLNTLSQKSISGDYSNHNLQATKVTNTLKFTNIKIIY